MVNQASSMYQKIYCVNHIGKNLLIVGYHPQKQWEFRIVTAEGKIVQEVDGFENAEDAEKNGQKWIATNL